MLSDLSDEEIEVKTGVKVPSKNIEYIKRKNELRALERHVINIIFNLGGEPAEDSEEISSLLRRRSLRMLMEEKAAKPRAEPRWTEYRRVALRRSESRSTEVRGEGNGPYLRRCCQSPRYRKAKFTKLQRVESVRVEQVKHQWTEIQQVEHQTQTTESEQAIPLQWVDCRLLEPPETTPVLLAPVEVVQPTEIQKVTEVTVVKKIRIIEEIIEG